MDRRQLNTALREFFEAYSKARYRGIVIAVPSAADFALVRGQIEAILLEHDVWTEPGANGAPGIPCPRRSFMDAVFLPRRRDLAILFPNDWMLDWSEQDQATFWTGVAEAFGRHDILILTVATPMIVGQLRVSFREHRLSGLPISIWLSAHQPIDHLQGVLS